jgi:hypothetical protein
VIGITKEFGPKSSNFRADGIGSDGKKSREKPDDRPGAKKAESVTVVTDAPGGFVHCSKAGIGTSKVGSSSTLDDILGAETLAAEDQLLSERWDARIVNLEAAAQPAPAVQLAVIGDGPHSWSAHLSAWQLRFVCNPRIALVCNPRIARQAANPR